MQATKDLFCYSLKYHSSCTAFYFNPSGVRAGLVVTIIKIKRKPNSANPSDAELGFLLYCFFSARTNPNRVSKRLRAPSFQRRNSCQRPDHHPHGLVVVVLLPFPPSAQPAKRCQVGVCLSVRRSPGEKESGTLEGRVPRISNSWQHRIGKIILQVSPFFYYTSFRTDQQQACPNSRTVDATVPDLRKHD